MLIPAGYVTTAYDAKFALSRDKKARDGRIRLVLLDDVGKPRTGAEPPEGEVRAALDSLIAG